MRPAGCIHHAHAKPTREIEVDRTRAARRSERPLQPLSASMRVKSTENPPWESKIAQVVRLQPLPTGPDRACSGWRPHDRLRALIHLLEPTPITQTAMYSLAAAHLSSHDSSSSVKLVPSNAIYHTCATRHAREVSVASEWSNDSRFLHSAGSLAEARQRQPPELALRARSGRLHPSAGGRAVASAQPLRRSCCSSPSAANFKL